MQRWRALGLRYPSTVRVSNIVAVDKQLIEYIPFPDALRGKYQSFTEADLGQLRRAGYREPFATVEEGVADYVRRRLEKV